MDDAAVAALAAALADPARLALYWSKIVTVPASDCLWWTGAVSSRSDWTDGGGHGRFCLAPGRVVITHRFAYAVVHGVERLGRRRLLGHRCDSPSVGGSRSAKDRPRECSGLWRERWEWGGPMNESQQPVPDAPEMVRIGIYWHRNVHDLARSAYVADLDATPAGPEFFVDWLRSALEEHAALTPGARADRVGDLPELETGRGFNQMYPLPSDLLDRVEQAIIEDRRQLGRVSSRSAFTREAVLVAVEAARSRRGGTLPPPPSRLPNWRPRRA